MLVITLVSIVIVVVSFLAVLGETRPILYASTILTICNDIIFIPLGDDGDNSLALVAKSWREIFVASVLLSFVLWMGRGRRGVRLDFDIALCLFILVGLTLLGTAVGLGGASPFVVLNSARVYMLPLILPIALYSCGAFSRDAAKGYYWIVLVLAVGMAAYSIVLRQSFTDRITDLWYYDFVADRKLSSNTARRLIAYQFLRDGNLRAPGFLTSAVDYSVLSGVISVFAIGGVLFATGFIKRVCAFIALLACVVGIQLSETRAGFVILVVGTLIIFSFRFARLRLWFVYPAVALCVITATIYAIQRAPGSFDSSLGGRPAQLVQAISSFKPQGWGFGSVENNGPTYKDSLYLSTIGTFGFASVGYFLVLLTVFRKIVISFRFTAPNTDARALILSALGAFGAMWFIFGFHYSLGNASYYTLMLLCFGALGALRDKKTDFRLEQFIEPTSRGNGL